MNISTKFSPSEKTVEVISQLVAAGADVALLLALCIHVSEDAVKFTLSNVEQEINRMKETENEVE